MSGLKRLFCEHPGTANETYFEHLLFACGFGLRMIFGGLACIIHGIFPFLCVWTGSQSVCDLHEQLASNGRPATSDLKRDQVVQS